jgi:response regulator RpfG family c-di-GMP phosphodiesterase
MRKVRIKKLESGMILAKSFIQWMEALCHIVSRVGTEFDPEMVKVFVEIIEK